MSRPKIKKRSLSMEERQRMVKALAALAHAAGDACILCGGHPEALGVFTPKDQEVYDAPDGRRLYFPYHVCTECAEKRWGEVMRIAKRKRGDRRRASPCGRSTSTMTVKSTTGHIAGHRCRA